MNTREITQGAMVCAIYGLILFLNQQTALFIESGLSWIFVFPILIYTAKTNKQAGMIGMIAMGLETIFFGGFTTWFYSWTSLFIGYVYGVGIQQHWQGMSKLAITFIFTMISYLLIFFLWAKLFEIDYAADFVLIQKFIPYINITTFILLMVLSLSILQTLCIHLLASLICMRMRIESVPLKNIWQIEPSKPTGIVSLAIFVVLFLGNNVIKYSKGIQNFILIILFIDLIALDYYGTIYLLKKYGSKNRKLVFLICLGAFIPGVNIIWMLLGEVDCLFNLQLKEKR